VSRIRLRTRVLLLTSAFALVLIAITFGLSWRAKESQERWSRLIAVETEAVAKLEEVIRAQNAFRARSLTRRNRVERYREVEQLLDQTPLKEIDVTALRVRVDAFRKELEAGEATRDELAAESIRITSEAQRIIGERKGEISRQLPMLERDTRAMMLSGLGIAWIIIVLAFGVVKTTYNRVVRPLEDLSKAAERITSGDLTASVPTGGDMEIMTVGAALNTMVEELKSRARTDDLTMLPNFRAFRERIDGEIERANRYRSTFGILVLDLDRFKQYNDDFGHLAGNEALQRVAEVIRETVRAVDYPARYGGEEFAVIAPQVDIPSLGRIAERIRVHIEAMPAPPDGAEVTISIGAAIFPADGATAEALFHAADERLYEAKRLGRNRVVVTSAVPAVQSAV
jgi:diguanylate cyclase (GGDEF)-like protein